MPDKNTLSVDLKLLNRTKAALEKNNMNAFVANDCAEAISIVKSLLKKGATVGLGGSMSVFESGCAELLKSGDYNFLDRSIAEDVTKLYRETFFADFYLCSSNAVTQNGELYNVDGNGNRVACICYGPEKVIMIVGKNKIVPTVKDAVMRVKQIAAPANCARLSRETYCLEKGKCMGAEKGICDGCLSPQRICSSYVISGYQHIKGRINVILVNENLGY